MPFSLKKHTNTWDDTHLHTTFLKTMHWSKKYKPVLILKPFRSFRNLEALKDLGKFRENLHIKAPSYFLISFLQIFENLPIKTIRNCMTTYDCSNYEQSTHQHHNQKKNQTWQVESLKNGKTFCNLQITYATKLVKEIKWFVGWRETAKENTG